MKKILFTLIFITITNFTNVYAEERENKLKNLFELLRDADTSGIANQVEMEIWSIWTTHPYEENLTKLLTKGSILMAENKLYEAYDVFSTVIELDPVWAEGWNKRATGLYLLGRYQESQNDIEEVLKLEKRHFGALAGQGLVQKELKNYSKAIQSYKEVQEIYPSMKAPKIMIPLLEKLAKNEFI